jgi:CRP-like cAMP-binding protein
MLQRLALETTGIRFVPRDAKCSPLAHPSPRQNHLLAALPASEYERLLPDLEPVPLPQGWVVHGAGARERQLHFITAGLVSRICVMDTGVSTEFAVTGSEGVIGIASFLGGGATTSAAVVLSAGHAFRLEAGVLEGGRHGFLAQLLLRYTQAMIAQTGQIAACNRHHSVEQQLCRWILSCLDRLPSNRLAMTHDLVARMMGVRRESVSQAAGRLQGQGLIHCRRGRIVVLDRFRLEARACECYAVIKREYDRLLP